MLTGETEATEKDLQEERSNGERLTGETEQRRFLLHKKKTNLRSSVSPVIFLAPPFLL
jgi:hypothetical protein